MLVINMICQMLCRMVIKVRFSPIKYEAPAHPVIGWRQAIVANLKFNGEFYYM